VSKYAFRLVDSTVVRRVAKNSASAASIFL